MWVQRAVEQGFARSEEMQQKVAGSEAELCLGAQPRLWQSCCAGAAQPGRRGAVSARVPASPGCCAPSRHGFYQLRVQLLLMNRSCCPHLSASLRVPLQAAAAQRQSPQWAQLQQGSFHHTVVFGYFWQFHPAKAKNPSELTSCSIKTRHCALSQTCTNLPGLWSQHGRNHMAGQWDVTWVSSSKAILSRFTFFPPQPVHLCTYPPGLPLIPLSAHTSRYPASEQFDLLLCHA